MHVFNSILKNFKKKNKKFLKFSKIELKTRKKTCMRLTCKKNAKKRKI